jgi:RNA polymerase sigma factor (sigma-70 family)
MVEPSNPGYYASRPKKFSEYVLLQVAKDSDPVRANKAKDKLIKDNELFLKYFIGDWIDTGSPYIFDELLQAAREAFSTAIEKYDLSRDVSIRTVAKYHLLKLKENFFKTSPYVELKDIHLDGEYLLADPDINFSDLRETLNEAISCLNSSEQAVIKLHFFEGLKGRAIAASKGISEARVSALMKAALDKLRKHLIGKGIQPGIFNFN